MFSHVGPFVGVSHNEARIWFKAEPNLDYTVEIQHQPGKEISKIMHTDENGIGIAEFRGLLSDKPYSYDIRSNSGNSVLTKIENPGFSTFPTPGDEADLTFAFFSCNRPQFTSGLEGAKPYSMQMWQQLGELCAINSDNSNPEVPRFLLGIGDQIYADDLWKGKKPRRRYAKMSPKDLVNAYSQVYDKFLGLKQIREVTARCPIFMTWDDHEIRDGWGSQGNEEDKLPQKMFQAANDAYIKYQLSYNPHLANPNHRYYAFRYGKIGFVVLDLRGYRSVRDKKLLDDKQWEWLEGWLQTEGTQCEVVFVACSVPFIHLTNQIVQLGGKWFGKILVRIFGVADDFIDQWNSEPFIKDAKRLAERLFELANDKGIRFVLLGGDVHVGTFAVLRSYRSADQYHPVIYQFTSSPISNRPTWVAKFLKIFGSEIELRPDLPFKGRLLRIITERNFGIVKVRRHADTGAYSVVFEAHCQKTGIQTFATMW